MLETSIKDLATAITLLANAIQATATLKTRDVVETSADKPKRARVKKDPVDPASAAAKAATTTAIAEADPIESKTESKTETETETVVTVEECKQLAKTKMAEGVARATIKALVVSYGAGTISELDDKSRPGFYNDVVNLEPAL